MTSPTNLSNTVKIEPSESSPTVAKNNVEEGSQSLETESKRRETNAGLAYCRWSSHAPYSRHKSTGEGSLHSQCDNNEDGCPPSQVRKQAGSTSPVRHEPVVCRNSSNEACTMGANVEGQNVDLWTQNSEILLNRRSQPGLESIEGGRDSNDRKILANCDGRSSGDRQLSKRLIEEDQVGFSPQNLVSEFSAGTGKHNSLASQSAVPRHFFNGSSWVEVTTPQQEGSPPDFGRHRGSSSSSYTRGLEKLSEKFTSLNTACGQLLKQNRPPSWKNIEQMISGSQQTLNMDDVRKLALYFPQMVMLRKVKGEQGEDTIVELYDPFDPNINIGNHYDKRKLELASKLAVERRQKSFDLFQSQLSQRLQCLQDEVDGSQHIRPTEAYSRPGPSTENSNVKGPVILALPAQNLVYTPCPRSSKTQSNSTAHMHHFPLQQGRLGFVGTSSGHSSPAQVQLHILQMQSDSIRTFSPHHGPLNPAQARPFPEHVQPCSLQAQPDFLRASTVHHGLTISSLTQPGSWQAQLPFTRNCNADSKFSISEGQADSNGVSTVRQDPSLPVQQLPSNAAILNADYKRSPVSVHAQSFSSQRDPSGISDADQKATCTLEVQPHLSTGQSDSNGICSTHNSTPLLVQRKPHSSQEPSGSTRVPSSDHGASLSVQMEARPSQPVQSNFIGFPNAYHCTSFLNQLQSFLVHVEPISGRGQSFPAQLLSPQQLQSGFSWHVQLQPISPQSVQLGSDGTSDPHHGPRISVPVQPCTSQMQSDSTGDFNTDHDLGSLCPSPFLEQMQSRSVYASQVLIASQVIAQCSSSSAHLSHTMSQVPVSTRSGTHQAKRSEVAPLSFPSAADHTLTMSKVPLTSQTSQIAYQLSSNSVHHSHSMTQGSHVLSQNGVRHSQTAVQVPPFSSLGGDDYSQTMSEVSSQLPFNSVHRSLTVFSGPFLSTSNGGHRSQATSEIPPIFSRDCVGVCHLQSASPSSPVAATTALSQAIVSVLPPQVHNSVSMNVTRQRHQQQWDMWELALLIQAKKFEMESLKTTSEENYIETFGKRWRDVEMWLKQRMVVDKNAFACRKKWESLLCDYRAIKCWDMNSPDTPYSSLTPLQKENATLPMVFTSDLITLMDSFPPGAFNDPFQVFSNLVKRKVSDHTDASAPDCIDLLSRFSTENLDKRVSHDTAAVENRSQRRNEHVEPSTTHHEEANSVPATTIGQALSSGVVAAFDRLAEDLIKMQKSRDETSERRLALEEQKLQLKRNKMELEDRRLVIEGEDRKFMLGTLRTLASAFHRLADKF